jgi:hypothetical protein
MNWAVLCGTRVVSVRPHAAANSVQLGTALAAYCDGPYCLYRTEGVFVQPAIPATEPTVHLPPDNTHTTQNHTDSPLTAWQHSHNTKSHRQSTYRLTTLTQHKITKTVHLPPDNTHTTHHTDSPYFTHQSENGSLEPKHVANCVLMTIGTYLFCPFRCMYLLNVHVLCINELEWTVSWLTGHTVYRVFLGFLLPIIPHLLHTRLPKPSAVYEKSWPVSTMSHPRSFKPGA